MTSNKAIEALNVVEDLEKNSKRLSTVVEELITLRDSMNELQDEVKKAQLINQESQKELRNMAAAVKAAQEKLTTEFKLLLAESNAEQSSRIKDANENLIKLDGLTRSLQKDLADVKSEDKKNKELLASVQTSVEKLDEKQNQIIPLAWVILIVLVGIAGKVFGFLEKLPL
jgi:chromosome segregation ATPase